MQHFSQNEILAMIWQAGPMVKLVMLLLLSFSVVSWSIIFMKYRFWRPLFCTRRSPPFIKNRSSRLIKSPKLYFTDSGVAAYLAGARSLQPGRDDLLRGALFETYVAQNQAALLEAHRPDAHLTYWHEQGRHEVDFVIEQGRDEMAIEVKAATRWSERDLSGLRAFLDRTPSCVAAVLAYNGREAVQLSKLLYALPLGHLLA